MLVLKKVSNKIIIKRAASIFTLSVLFLGIFYVLFSPLLIAATQSVESNPGSLSQNLFSLLRGFGSYQAMAATTGSVTVTVAVGKEVSITAPGNFSLTGTINGISGGTATGNAAFSVLNSSELGFNMTIKASTSPALATGSYNFSDYSPNASTGTPDYTWAAPSAGSSSFAFSVGADTGTYANQKFRNTSSLCNQGSTNSTTNCWSGFNGTTAIPVVSTSAFSSVPVTETISLKAAFTSGNNTAMEADANYQATITATVATN